MSDWRDQEARNQALFREVNEQIERLAEDFGADGQERLICECGNQDCNEPIELTRGEYERVRGYANRFLVALNHENPETESIIEQNERFAVVETYAGAPSQIARDTDPRAQQHLRGTRTAAAGGGQFPMTHGRALELLEVARSTDAAVAGIRCAGRGYGASPGAEPKRCPMCGGHLWDGGYSGWSRLWSQVFDQRLTRDAER